MTWILKFIRRVNVQAIVNVYNSAKIVCKIDRFRKKSVLGKRNRHNHISFSLFYRRDDSVRQSPKYFSFIHVFEFF